MIVGVDSVMKHDDQKRLSVMEAEEYARHQSFEIRKDFAEYWNECHWWQKLYIFIFHHDDYKLL